MGHYRHRRLKSRYRMEPVLTIQVPRKRQQSDRERLKKRIPNQKGQEVISSPEKMFGSSKSVRSGVRRPNGKVLIKKLPGGPTFTPEDKISDGGAKRVPTREKTKRKRER
ncbi:hypothetical protein E4U24_000717 [Claviceps purpurea]|nr:hypothetical protein E4U24_000717 [Claviceps purpurea]